MTTEEVSIQMNGDEKTILFNGTVQEFLIEDDQHHRPIDKWEIAVEDLEFEVPRYLPSDIQKRVQARMKRWLSGRGNNADQRRINVDFDGTITTGDVEYWNGERPEVDEEVAQWVRQQYHDYNTIVIWTARPWSEAHRIAAHLTEWEIPYHGLRCEKGSADSYVDDKMIDPQEVDFHEQR